MPLPRPSSLVYHHGALLIGMLAASDLAYRLLLREPVRRALGMHAQRPTPMDEDRVIAGRPRSA